MIKLEWDEKKAMNYWIEIIQNNFESIFNIYQSNHVLKNIELLNKKCWIGINLNKKNQYIIAINASSCSLSSSKTMNRTATLEPRQDTCA